MTAPDDRDPQLLWTEAGEPRSARYGDVYFSAQDGLSESRAVFLAGCDLPNAWAGREVFTVAELGFGTGLNIAALLDLWHRNRPEGGRLHVFSIEGYPLSVEEARRALGAWPEIAEVAATLLDRWPPATPGFHRVDLPEFGAVLDLAVGEAEWALGQWTGQADAWFLDGFSPSTNPAMWSDAVMDALAARSAPDARVATFTVAGAVRRGLAERGFTVDKRPGHGRKRERLEARGQGTPTALPAPGRVAVIGAGVAGACVAHALRGTGWTPILLDAQDAGAGASGFPAALVTPRFDLGDAAVAALFVQALERADAVYSALQGAVVTCGVLQLPGAERDARRFEKVVHRPDWPAGQMQLLDPSPLLGEVVADQALAMAPAFVVAPPAVVAGLLGDTDVRLGEVTGLEAFDGGWRVLAADGHPLAEVSAVVVCSGAGTAALLPELSLSPIRGQAEWVEAPDAPAPIAWGGYVAPRAQGGFLFGATHDRGDTATDVRPADTARNLATLEARLPNLAAGLDRSLIQSRAATRATTRDRLPVAGALPERPGLYVLGGLGSRGFCLSPLLAEHVVALITGRPSPLPLDVSQRIAPSRPAAAALASSTPEEDPASP